MNNYSRTTVLGVKVDNLTLHEARERLDQLVAETHSSLICTPNSEIVLTAQRDSMLRDILNQESCLNIADGFGLLWSARYLSLSAGNTPVLREIVTLAQWLATIIIIPIFPKFFNHPIPERITGVDFTWDIARYAAKHNLKLYLLGGAPIVAEQCALRLQTDIPGLRIAGMSSDSPRDTENIVFAIRKSRADILLVAFGAPKQEKWLSANLKRTGCKIGIGVGGTFDIIAGHKKRAPLWMQKSGLEWLFRLIQEPSRLIRQLAIPQLMLITLIYKLMLPHKQEHA